MFKKEVIKVFGEIELNMQEKRKIEIKFIEIIKENRLSLNQVEEIFDSVKENLNKKPLWT